jgi:hypothetical protein
MHIYLIISKDYTQSFVYSNLVKAKKKCSEIDGIAFEWITLWCRPYNANLSEIDYIFDDTAKPWEMLKLAHEQNHWDTRAKYREDIFDSYIIGLSSHIAERKRNG